MKVEAAVRLPYPGGYPVYLARYILFSREEEGRFTAMRFCNASEIALTGIRFRLVELDKDGDPLTDHVVEQRGLFVERGSEFALADFAVSADCAALEAHLEAVFSDNYEYIVEDGGVRLVYGTSKPPEREAVFPQHAMYHVKKKKKIFFLIAILATVCFTAIAAGVAWRLGFFDKTETAAGQTESVVYEA